MDTMIAIINAHMIGAATEPGEYVDWSSPDVMPEQEWTDLLGMSVAEFADANPHMIVMAVESCLPGEGCGTGSDGHPCSPAYLCPSCIQQLLEQA